MHHVDSGYLADDWGIPSPVPKIWLPSTPTVEDVAKEKTVPPFSQ